MHQSDAYTCVYSKYENVVDISDNQFLGGGGAEMHIYAPSQIFQAILNVPGPTQESLGFSGLSCKPHALRKREREMLVSESYSSALKSLPRDLCLI